MSGAYTSLIINNYYYLYISFIYGYECYECYWESVRTDITNIGWALGVYVRRKYYKNTIIYNKIKGKYIEQHTIDHYQYILVIKCALSSIER